MDLENLLKWRRSYRKFDENKLLSQEDIDAILNSIKYASCANNRQYLRFISVEKRDKVLEIFNNSKWAASLANEAGRPKKGERPVYFVAILSDNEKKLRFDGVDQGLVISNMTITAAERGIGSCIIGSVNDKKMREILSYDDNYTCNLVVAFGYPKVKSTYRRNWYFSQSILLSWRQRKLYCSKI